MSQQKLLDKVVNVLNEYKIEYMVTGSLVSSLQGEPRLTHDIDLVVEIKPESVAHLITSFSSEDYYLDEGSIHDAIKRRSMFNLIDIKEGDKVDFWLLTDELFDLSRFARKYAVEFMGIKMKVSSPEDTILAKLRWSKLSGGSEKQYTDALRVYEVQFDRLDTDYIEKWVKKLNVSVLWERMKGEAEAL